MVIGSKIALFDAPPSMLKKMKDALELHNPAYGQALKRNPNARIFLSPYIKYWEEKNGVFYCGRGLEDRIFSYAEKHDIELEWSERTVKPYFPSKSTIQLRPYQEGVPEDALRAGEHGMLDLSPGFGKTIVSLRMAELLQTTALFVVPKKSIMDQYVVDIKKYFGFDAGVIGGGKLDVQPFTVATMQSLQRLMKKIRPEDAKHLSEYFGYVMADECHTTVPKKSRDVIEFFCPRHLYGQSGTIMRTDEQDEALEFMYGKVLVKGEIEQAKPTVEVHRFFGRIAMGEYHDIIDEQINDYERNKLIATVLEGEIAAGHKIIVLTKRTKHRDALLHHLRELVPERADRFVALSTRGTAQARTDELASLRSGDAPFDVLFATVNLAATGLDIPTISAVLFAGDLKSRILQIQGVGRARRILEGKKESKIIEIVDEGNPILRRQGKYRLGFYEEQNWEVKS